MLQALKAFALVGGDWILYLLLFLSLWCLAVIVDRFRAFRVLAGSNEGSLGEVEALLIAGRLPEAARRLGEARSVEASVLRECLSAKGLDREGLQEVFESAKIKQRLLLERHLLVLGTLGNNAPFIGLFGTVLGIIKAFNDLALQGTAGSTVVMRGISEALVATALGLLIAIPAVVAYNHFQGRIKRSLSNADRLGRLLLARVPSRKR
jgi:biopolymer transport protein ExbB